MKTKTASSFGTLRASARTAERIIERANDRPRLVPGDAVVDPLAVPARRDEALEPQPRQLLRHRRLAPREQRLQFADRLFAVQEIAENHQPRLVRQRLEKFARLARAPRHAADVHIWLGLEGVHERHGRPRDPYSPPAGRSRAAGSDAGTCRPSRPAAALAACFATTSSRGRARRSRAGPVRRTGGESG